MTNLQLAPGGFRKDKKDMKVGYEKKISYIA
jgi:hypothetical protein